jgi:hypothetical protein
MLTWIELALVLIALALAFLSLKLAANWFIWDQQVAKLAYGRGLMVVFVGTDALIAHAPARLPFPASYA